MDQILSDVAAHLERLRIKCKVVQPPVAKPAALARAEKKIGLPFPDQLKKFYLDSSDGLAFLWEHGEDMGFLQIPNLRNLVKDFEGWKELVLWKDDYDFPHTQDPKEAKKTYAAMKSWLPLIEVGGADGFCLDCASKRGAVVYHQHDWYDGGTGKNGHVLAPDLETFVARWAKVCFMSPTGLHWPSTFAKNGVRWTGQYFDPKYIMAE